MRRFPVRVFLVAALAVILTLGLATATLGAPGSKGGNPRSSQGSAHSQDSSQLPVVKRVIPDSGPAEGGARVIIIGSGFQDVTDVDFGGAPASSYEVRSPHTITAMSPGGTPGETVDITVTTVAGTSDTGDQDQYTYEDASVPVVKRIAPNTGPATGDARVMIIGSGFQDVTSVDFGAAPATSFVVLSTRVITAVSPAGTAGETVDVTVTTSMGTSATGSDVQYTYVAVLAPVVRHVAPNSGLATGGVRVIIIGSGFQGVTGVDFGVVAASSFRVLNSHVIMAISPAGTAGETVDITVTTAVGTSATNSVSKYTYRAPKSKEE